MTAMKVTEENFIPLLCRKHEKALEYCMLHYGGLVKAVVHRYLGSLPQYEEECQNDVFFAVWNHIDAYDPERNPFANWIAGVARLKALDCKRKYASRMLETSWGGYGRNRTARDTGRVFCRTSGRRGRIFRGNPTDTCLLKTQRPGTFPPTLHRRGKYGGSQPVHRSC